MLHASTRIMAHFLMWPRSWFVLSLWGFLFKSIIHQNWTRSTHVFTHKHILRVNRCLHVYLHMRFPQQHTSTLSWIVQMSPERGKSVFHLSWMCASEMISFAPLTQYFHCCRNLQRLKIQVARLMLRLGFRKEMCIPDKPRERTRPIDETSPCMWVGAIAGLKSKKKKKKP